MTVDRPSAFVTERSRDAFHAAYERALERSWPVPVRADDVETAFGTVHLHRHGPEGPDPFVLLAGAGGNDGADAARWLDDVLAAVGAERAHLVGVSYGGWTALQHQLRRPQRVGAVTLIDPAGFAPLTARFYRWLVLCGLAGLLPDVPRERAARRLVNGTLLHRELLRLGLAGRGFRRRLPRPPVVTDQELRSIAVPVQLLLGACSALHDSAAVAERVARVVPSWRTEVVPGAGHALVLDRVDLSTSRLLDFAPTRS